MYENLELINKHHLTDLQREAHSEMLLQEALKGKDKSKKARGVRLFSLLASVIHIR